MEVNPPSINTGKAFRAINDNENCTPDLAPHMMPATNATKPAMHQTITQIFLKLMPTESAA